MTTAREKYQCDGPIDRIQALLHDDPNQNAMQRLIDSLGLKDDLCDIRWNPSENMPIASDKEGEVNDQEKNHPLNSNDHEDAITTLGKQIISLQNGSTVYQVFNDNEPRRLRFPNARPQCGECGMVFGRRNCLVRHFINRQNRWSSMGYRLISSYRTLQPTDVSAFFAGDISNYWFRDFKDLDQKWRKLMKGCDLVDLNTIDIVDHHSLKCFLITMMTIMTKSNNGGGQSCHSKKQLLYHVGDKDHYLRVEFRNK